MNKNHLPATTATNNTGPEWVYYASTMDGKRTVIALDLRFAADAPTEAFPYLFRLTIGVRHQNEEGFPVPSEMTALARLEETLLASLDPNMQVLVGRVTLPGLRELVFYTHQAERLNRQIEHWMTRNGAFGYRSSSMFDAHWEYYFGYLFPNEQELSGIFTRKMMGLIEAGQEGGSGAEPCVIEHKFYFSAQEDRDNFILQAIDTYFSVDNTGLSAEYPATPWMLRISRQELLDIGHMNQLTLHFVRSATEVGAVYDGWRVKSKN